MSNPIVFRRGDTIGEPDAQDDAFLNDCFIDNGDWHSIIDTTNPASILLGRIGSGKSALVKRIAHMQENVILIDPESLSLNQIASSPVIRFFEDAGVHMNPFYDLLWRHIFVVELLRKKYDLKTENSQASMLSRLAGIFSRDKPKQQALAYLSDWGQKFWEETQYRVKEFTEALEHELKSGISGKSYGLDASISGRAKLNSAQKSEVLSIGQRAVAKVQVKKLRDVMDLLAQDIFVNKQERFYICIDRLDEDWAGDDIRFKLLRSLLETIRTFRRIEPVKIVVTLRTDLYFSMLRRIESFGFQEEKYSSYYVHIKWSKEKLRELLDTRVHEMFVHKYSGNRVHLDDILPSNAMHKKSSFEYIIGRTARRPREAISYLNKCIDAANGTSKITSAHIKSAEVPYSDERLRSIFEEWRREYPYLNILSEFLRGLQSNFEFLSVPIQKYTEFAEMQYQKIDADLYPKIRRLLEDLFSDASATRSEFMRFAAPIFYQVGLCGVKFTGGRERIWSFEDRTTIEGGEINLDTKFSIHRSVHAALGVRTMEF